MLKKSFIFSIIIVFIVISINCYAGINADLGTSIVNGIQDSVNIRAEVNGAWRDGETGFKLYHYCYREKTDNILVGDRRITELEANYYPTRWSLFDADDTELIVFLDGGSYRDVSFGMDEIRVGLGSGLGFQRGRLISQAKAGFYVIDESRNQDLSFRIDENIRYQLTHILVFEEQGDISFNTSQDVYQINFDFKSVAMISEQFALVVGVEVNYDSSSYLPKNSVEKYYTALRINL